MLGPIVVGQARGYRLRGTEKGDEKSRIKSVQVARRVSPPSPGERRRLKLEPVRQEDDALDVSDIAAWAVKLVGE